MAIAFTKRFPAGRAFADYMNSALSEAGGFSDALQRGALPAFDNVALN